MEEIGVRDPLTNEQTERLRLPGIFDGQLDLLKPSLRSAWERAAHRKLSLPVLWQRPAIEALRLALVLIWPMGMNRASRGSDE